eukprot:scaffold5886_cov161-Amphora_coffeaeformis.AAC.2
MWGDSECGIWMIGGGRIFGHAQADHGRRKGRVEELWVHAECTRVKRQQAQGQSFQPLSIGGDGGLKSW